MKLLPRIKTYSLLSVCTFQLILLLGLSAAAQDDPAAQKKWKFLVEPYLMFPNINGTIGIGTLPNADVDATAGDVFSRFRGAAVFYLEMANEKWSFGSNLVYMNLREDAEPDSVINSGNVKLKLVSWELGALRRLLPWLEAGVGGRLNSANVSIDLISKTPGGGSTAHSRSMTRTWFDPILIARVKSAAEENFIYQLRADMGGFGIGSAFAWQLQVDAGYRFSKLFQATVGYRLVSTDYNKGSASDRFLYDVNNFGPVIRLGFNF